MKRVVFLLLVVLAILPHPVPAEPPSGVANSLQLVEATVSELKLALRSHLITSEQLVQMYLNRISAYEDVGPALNSIIHLNENALEEARARDLDRHRGRAHGPLFGIPVLLKDNIDTADMPTTAGSVALEGSIPPDDANITQRLRAAGAIILGKATLTEFANFIAIGMRARRRLPATLLVGPRNVR
jgi:amidase